jgi:hypothetical protein
MDGAAGQAAGAAAAADGGAAAPVAPQYVELKSGGRARVPVLNGKGKADFQCTYADLIRQREGKPSQCTRCGDDLPEGEHNMKPHWGSCCMFELTEDDQKLSSVSRARGKRTAAAAGTAPIASMFARATSTLRSRVGMRGILLLFLCMARLAFNVVESPAVRFLVEHVGGSAAVQAARRRPRRTTTWTTRRTCRRSCLTPVCSWWAPTASCSRQRRPPCTRVLVRSQARAVAAMTRRRASCQRWYRAPCSEAVGQARLPPHGQSQAPRVPRRPVKSSGGFL